MMTKNFAKTALVLLALVLALGSGAQAQQTEIKWFGHAAFSITTPKGKVLIIDPWLKNPVNPEAADGKDPLAAITRADYILLTHGHFDHVGETVEIAKKTGAKLVTNFELGTNLVKLQGFPEKQATFETIADIGGAIQTPDGEVTMTLTSAVHSSSVENPNAGANEPKLVEGGNPGGFVIQIKDGPTIYDSGDTAFFQDMKTIGEEFRIDVALLFIGGHSGMGPQIAAKAAQAVNARLAIPQHYGDLPGFTTDASGFAAALKKYRVPFYEMKPGQTITFNGAKLQPSPAGK